MMHLIVVIFFIFGWQYDAYSLVFNKENPIYYFTNHEEQLKSLREKLYKTKTVGITGITGMGKSEIARKYVQDYQQEYDIIAFFDANTDLISQFALLAKKINQQICPSEGCYITESPNAVKKSIMNYLKDRDKWLLVFDNLHVDENNRIEDIINWQHNGHVIICSQDDKYLLTKISVPYLEIEEARIIINKIMTNTSENFVEELVEVLHGYPPYIIGHSATFLANNNYVTVKEYIEQMKNTTNKIRAHLKTVFGVISPQAQDVLFKMSVLNNQKVSRKLLEQLFDNDAKLSDSIQEIIRFGVIEQISEDRDNQIFRMHDAIKDELLLLADVNLKKQNINNILSRLNRIIPQSVNNRVAFVQNVPTLEENLEILLKNSEEFQADKYEVMQLREKLLWYYWIGLRQPHNAKKMVDWLENHKDEIKISFQSDEVKASYTGYLTYIGRYYYVANQDYGKALSYLNIAVNSLKKFSGNDELKSYVYATLAYMQMHLGEVIEAEKNLEKAEKARPEIPVTFLGLGLIELHKSMLLLIKGKYQEALDMVLADIKKSKEGGFSKGALFPEYLTQASILNYMQRYEEAHEVINTNIYQHIKNKKKETSSLIKARTLIEFARAEVGLRKISEALEHAQEAVSLLTYDEEKNNIDVSNSKDVYLASALAVEGDALAALGKIKEAIDNYKLAKNIYFSLYDARHIKNMDHVSWVFSNGAKIASKLTDIRNRRIECGYFRQLQTKYFGESHPRSIEIRDLCD
jgi:tetratricopeptide (TPR) repeat protein